MTFHVEVHQLFELIEAVSVILEGECAVTTILAKHSEVVEVSLFSV